MNSNHRIYVGKDAHKFSAAHMTVFPDGTKERLHGHNFQVSVAIDLKDVSFKSFLDFSIIKEALNGQCKALDDRLLLAEKCPHLQIIKSDKVEVEFTLCNKRYVVPADEVLLLPLENIATETLAMEFGKRFVQRLDATLIKRLIVGVEVNITESRGQGGMCYWRNE